MTANPKISHDRTSHAMAAGIDSPERPAAPPPAEQSHPGSRNTRRPAQLNLWLHRVTVLLFVFVCAVVGVLLVILPWRPEWTDNRLLLTYPSLRAVVANGFVRGLCSGLGMLDIWIGFWEAIQYHEGERP
ncbi:MAG: hypothetical protein ACLP6G_22310 [Terriglobales bacterium]